jgi:hypothetical protein
MPVLGGDGSVYSHHPPVGAIIQELLCSVLVLVPQNGASAFSDLDFETLINIDKH